MDDALSKILTKPLTSRNARKMERLAGRGLKHGGATFVADLGIGLARHHRSAAEFDRLFDRLVRLLAVTPGRRARRAAAADARRGRAGGSGA
ncbi:DUF6183 family protein [Kitasatospora sp. NPDC057965]|uniref:DUF6183 family protein n=1 Tax=Kitasatospora sp. NPDC057965 TaxID=3346291 RepID=UPI0036DF2758